MTSPIVDAAWLQAHLREPNVRVADVRWYLAGKSGADEYAKGHIPGAVFVDLDRELAASSGPGRHPLPLPAAFAESLARFAVTRDTLVVAYDDAGGAMAARLWWLLRWCGLEGRVLDGGLQAWMASGGELSTATPHFVPAGPLALAPDMRRVVDKAAVDRARRDPRALVLDARATERFEGRVEPIDARAGHIPGARSAPFVENLVAPGGTFKSEDALRARYEALGAGSADQVICYCGSGVTACHDLLALAIAGRDDALLYEGSWSDWARDASLPVGVGPDAAPPPQS